MRNAARPGRLQRAFAQHAAARLVAVVASVAALAVLVQVPCSMGAEVCALRPVAGAASPQCPIEPEGGRAMSCCAKGEAPRRSAPATPASPDSGQRYQVKVLPAGADAALALPAAPPVTELPAGSRAAAPAASATPLYTLLSTLLS